MYIDETSNVSMVDVKDRYYIYVLFSLNDRGLYIGYSTNIKNRLIQHASGLVVATKNRLPMLLIHYEYFINRHDAKSREVFLKSGFGRKQLHNILKKTIESLQSD